MWDPGNYEDTDFGLDEDESFEPEGSEEWDDVDLTQPHVRTVLGAIPPDALGVCLPFEYLNLPIAEGHLPGEFHLPSRDGEIAEELEAYFVSGGRSIVSLVPVSSPNALERLQAIGRRVPVHIIAASNGNTPGDAGGSLPAIAGLTIIEGAAIPPAVETDPELPLVIRAGDVRSVPAIRSLREQRGTTAAATTVLVPGTSLPEADLIDLAANGCMIGFEGVGTDATQTEAITASIVSLMAAGHTDRVLVSPGLQRADQYITQGGSPGWIYLLEFFTLHLMAAGASAMDVRAILIDNPATALSVVPAATQSAPKSV